MIRRKRTIFSGLLEDNMILSSLMLISPVIICGDTVKNALSLIYAFNTITFTSLILGSFIPRKLPYTIRIIIYALISSLVYIPVRWFAVEFYPDSIQRIGIYYPLIAVNSLIILQSEAIFYRMKKGRMILSLIFYIIGFDLVMLITGVIREFFAYGTFFSRVADIDTTIKGLGCPFSGFIFLGLMCGIYRWIRSAVSSAGESEDD